MPTPTVRYNPISRILHWLIAGLIVSQYVLAKLAERAEEQEEVVRQLDADRYYRWLTYAVVPLHFVVLIVAAWWASSAEMSAWIFAGFAATANIGLT